MVGPQWQERIGELERGSSDDDGTGTKGSGCSGRGSLPACSCFNESGARYSRGPRVSRIVFVNCVLGKIGGYERERGYADAWESGTGSVAQQRLRVVRACPPSVQSGLQFSITSQPCHVTPLVEFFPLLFRQFSPSSFFFLSGSLA